MRRQYPDEQSSWLRDVFEGLDEASIEQLLAAGKVYNLEEGDLVPEPREALIRIESGLVKMAVTAEDRNLSISLFGPNDSIISPLFHPWETPLYTIEAQETSVVRIIPRDAVMEMAARNPQFSQELMRQLSWGCWQLMSTIHMLAFYNLPQRVARVLVNLATVFGIPDERRGIRLGLRLTQEELAELAGARRETQSTVLQEFRDDEILDLRYARIDIKDMEGLKRLAGMDALPFLKPGKIGRS